MKTTPAGALTVDLEDWRCALNPVGDVDYRRRPAIDEDYLRSQTKRLLSRLEEAGSRATFFVLGEVAESVPEVVTEIARSGHEIASHSPVHLPPHLIPKKEYSEMICRDVSVLQELAGARPIGFRVPYFSVSRSDGWLLRMLGEHGFKYDSSVVPTWTPYWGLPSAPKMPYTPSLLDLSRECATGPIVEIPVSVWPSWRFLPGLPIGGGFYMRAWPTRILLKALHHNVARGMPLVLYIHPGNLDSHKEVMSNVTIRDRLSQYAVPSRGPESFRRILNEFRFDTVASVFSSHIGKNNQGQH